MIRALSLITPLVTSLVSLLAAGPLPAQAPAKDQPQTQTFQGEIEVREVGLVVEPLEKGTFKPQDLLVFEAGTPRQVLKAEPLRPENGVRPWTIVLYFDRALATPETTHGAALALARQAGRLTGLGTVAVAIAEPQPRVELAATTDTAALSHTLGLLAEQTQQRKAAKPEPPDPALLRRRLDQMTTFLASQPGAGARALFLVMDGFVPPPGEADLMAAADTGDPAPPGTATAALRETSRLLAAGGWVTFAVPFRDTAPTREQRAQADMERIRIQGGGSEHTNSAPPVIPMSSVGRGTLRHPSVADVFTRPESAPLLALTQPTAGTVLGVDEQIRPAVDGLAQRWRVWYQAPEALDGKLRPVEVRLPAAAAALRGARWVQSSAPAELDAARARLLAGGLAVPGGSLPVEAALQNGKLHLHIAPSPGDTAGPIRISLAFDNRSEAHHLLLSEVSLEKGWEHTLDPQIPNGTKRIGIVVEALSPGRWGGTAVDLGAR